MPWSNICVLTSWLNEIPCKLLESLNYEKWNLARMKGSEEWEITLDLIQLIPGCLGSWPVATPHARCDRGLNVQCCDGQCVNNRREHRMGTVKVVTNVGEWQLQQIKTVSTKIWKFCWDCQNVTFVIPVHEWNVWDWREVTVCDTIRSEAEETDSHFFHFE